MFNKTYTTDGTGTWGYANGVPGDVAAIIRYSTADRSSKNHPIYCFNYYHGVQSQGGPSNMNLLDATQSAALATYAAAWITGFSDGTTTHKRSRPGGNLVTGSLVESNLTHRDLPR